MTSGTWLVRAWAGLAGHPDPASYGRQGQAWAEGGEVKEHRGLEVEDSTLQRARRLVLPQAWQTLKGGYRIWVTITHTDYGRWSLFIH